MAKKPVNSSKVAEAKTEIPDERKGMTMAGRVAIFLGFPTLVGLIGMYIGYNDPSRELKFDSDFAVPFMLALSMTLVIGFQTRGYTKDKPDPMVLWPKVRKRRRVVHKHVVVNADGTEEEVIVDEPEGSKEKDD
jgi:hypothetical protein